MAAFAPPAAQYSVLFRSTSTSLSASISLPSISNPLKKLPWNVEKEKAAEARRVRQEAALLYRELGIADDASYEEIVAATDVLIAKADGDIKKKVKVEITKDKILQLRLQQRVAGQMAEVSQARVERSIISEANEGKKVKTKSGKPKWFEDVYKPSENEQEQTNNLILYGLTLLFVMLNPALANGFKFVSTILTCGRLLRRGMPKYSRNNPPPKGATSHYMKGLAFCVSYFLILNNISRVLFGSFLDASEPAKAALLEQLQHFIIQPAFWWAANNIQFYKGPSTSMYEE